MKPLVIWAAGVVVAFAGLFGVTNATRDTDQVFVVVDASFFMQDVWSRVPGELDRIDDRDHAEFALATVARRSGEIHGYQASIDPIDVEASGPCSFADLNSFAGSASADERILLTNAESIAECSTTELDGWTIVELR